MKKLAVYDMDGTLLNTPEKEEGKKLWKEKTGEEYPHRGWWGRRESLNTEIFDIQPVLKIYSKFKKDITDPNAYVIILTSRLEKLRPEVENVLDIHGIEPDELIMKKGNETKGDVILSYIKKFPNLEKIEVYDDFAGGMEHKIKELTDIKNILPKNIGYNIYYVNNNNGNYVLMESTNNILNLIQDELRKL
jgi:hypothetical protein